MQTATEKPIPKRAKNLLSQDTGSIWEAKSPMLQHMQRRRAEVTLLLLQPKSNDVILDVGCGDGYQINYFANSAAYVVGIDLAKSKLKKGKSNVPKADFVCASSSELPFKPETFNKVLCLELLEHLQHPQSTVDEINLVLKEQGVLIISVPYKEPIILTECIHCGKLTPHWGHIHTFDEEKIHNTLPKNYSLLKQERLCTAASSYHIFAALPHGLWKAIDSFTQMLPDMRPYWIISKFQKASNKRTQSPNSN